MNYPHLFIYRSLLIFSVILGVLIALMVRMSFLVFTIDFSYFHIGDFTHPTPVEFDVTNLGKSVWGKS